MADRNLDLSKPRRSVLKGNSASNSKPAPVATFNASNAINKLSLSKNGEVAPIPNPISTRTFSDLLPQGFLRFDVNSGQVYTETMEQDIARSQEALANLNPIDAVSNLFEQNSVDIVVGLVGLALVAISLFQIVKPV